MTTGRSADAVNAVIKAYDVRGVVGSEIDAAFVRDVGAAFARLMRRWRRWPRRDRARHA